MSGVSKERATLWSGCIGLTVLAGFLGLRPKWDGATPSPSGEPTTTKAKRVVIVGYIRASPVILVPKVSAILHRVAFLFPHVSMFLLIRYSLKSLCPSYSLTASIHLFPNATIICCVPIRPAVSLSKWQNTCEYSSKIGRA